MHRRGRSTDLFVRTERKMEGLDSFLERNQVIREDLITTISQCLLRQESENLGGFFLLSYLFHLYLRLTFLWSQREKF